MVRKLPRSYKLGRASHESMGVAVIGALVTLLLVLVAIGVVVGVSTILVLGTYKLHRLWCYTFHFKAWTLEHTGRVSEDMYAMCCSKCSTVHELGERSAGGARPVIKHIITYGEPAIRGKGVMRPGQLPR